MARIEAPSTQPVVSTTKRSTTSPDSRASSRTGGYFGSGWETNTAGSNRASSVAAAYTTSSAPAGTRTRDVTVR